MTTTIEARPNAAPTRGVARLAGLCFMIAGIAFTVGGASHPSDSGTGNKVKQLHDMLVDSSWYPSHAALLLAMILFAIGLFGLRKRADLAPGVERLLDIAFVIACVAVVSMGVHLGTALDAESVADGHQSLVSRIETVSEAIDAVWALALAALALAGGVTRTIGNRIALAFGVAGGVAFALASATIPYTDTFDPLFKAGSLLAIWAIIVGVIELRRPV